MKKKITIRYVIKFLFVNWCSLFLKYNYFLFCQRYGGENSIVVKHEAYDVEDEIEEIDYVEPEDRPLPVLSVILKEGDGNSSMCSVSILFRSASLFNLVLKDINFMLLGSKSIQI